MKLTFFFLFVGTILLMSHYGATGSFRTVRSRLSAPISKNPNPPRD